VILMSACVLQDPFQQYLEYSVVFGLSMCMARGNNSTVGNCFLGVGGEF